MEYRELTLNQRRVFIDTEQSYDAFREARERQRSNRGGMHWKVVNGREYLIRTFGGRGGQKSLGPRAPDTEAIYSNFLEARDKAKSAYSAATKKLKEQARMARAVRIARVPAVVASIARHLEQTKDADSRTLLIGTHALFAYEAAAGITIDTSYLASGDADILWDNRDNLKIAGLEGQGLMGLLHKVDSSFYPMKENGFRAVNQDGFMVDLIVPMPSPPQKTQQLRVSTLPDDLVAAEIKGLEWLICAPKMHQTIIDGQGYPATMTVPDPRVFALHKAWVAERPDRDPIKRKRDREQARLVTDIVREYLPNLPFSSEELSMLPSSIRPQEDQLPPGFEDEDGAPFDEPLGKKGPGADNGGPGPG